MKAVQTKRLAVRDFMSRGILSVISSSNVSRAARLMSDRNIGSVVVEGEKGPVGIFTERDLLGKVLAKKLDPSKTKVVDVLSPIVTVDSGASPHQAAQAMLKTRSRLLVFEEGELIGMVTATDIVKVIHRLGIPLDITDSASKRLVTVGASATIRSAAFEMASKGTGSVIVTKQGDPVGVFTERDLLKKVYAGAVSDATPVGEAASSPLITAEYGIDGKQAAEVMVSRGIKRLPLTRNGKIVAVVTARDLVESLANANMELMKQMKVSYGEFCPICNTRIDDTGLCGCGAGSE